ncbi:MAG TPA: exodeoxyribonuclease VII large subunit [Rhodospirillaceae bacterium]|nr:exodeoxyribonuclease VII large subunit [Rhodospirillaceae bacterium]
MTDPFAPSLSRNAPEFTVGELSLALKRTVEQAYEHLRVKGEISGCKRHSSGHIYFCLKDSDAVLDAVCWRGSAGRLAVTPEDGMEVVASGRLTTYPGRSKYQMVVDSLELAGQGALLKLLEDRRRRLAGEGLFDPARKKKLPFLPKVIGVVTSPTGAVIRDILHRLADRFPRPVLLWPVAVQGEGAAAEVAAAIEGFNALPVGGAVPRPDLLIVARGGGSLEDLWAFNEEVVVRAAAASVIPLISAVGHETDTTLIDFAADLRAPTPTGAAEMAVPVRRELLARLAELAQRQDAAALRLLDERRQRLLGLGRGLGDPARRLAELGRQLAGWQDRLVNALPNLLHRRRALLGQWAARLPSPHQQIKEKRHQLEAPAQRLGVMLDRGLQQKRAALDRLAAVLESLSYEQVLRRGFALVRDRAGQPVSAPEAAKAGERWTVTFDAGKTVPVVVEGELPTARRPTAGDGRQGKLL